MREKLAIGLALASGLLLAYDLYQVFMVLGDEVLQGGIYRILFFHVPGAFVGMIGYFVALTFSILYIAGGNLKYDALSASVVEVSLFFSLINIITGSIWARIIWGVWWTWDARLTSALVCILIFAGYLMLRRAIDEPTKRARLSAALAIFGCLDVVFVYKSIEWFRNNHPSPVLTFRTGGGNMDPGMERVLWLNVVALLMLATALVLVRTRQDDTAREIDSLRRLVNATAA
jgi:heme exporter protein C